MAQQMAKCEVYILVDGDGYYSVGADEDSAVEKYEEDYASSTGRRLVKVTVNVPMPTVVELVGTVDPDAVATLKVQ